MNHTIDLIKYIDEQWRVLLNPNFKEEILKRIKQEKITIKKISEITKTSMDSIWKFHEGRYAVNLKYLLNLCEVLQINQDRIYENIAGIFTGVRKSSFNLKQISIDEEFAAWWGLWIGEGDHSPKREAVSVTNYEINLLKIHYDMLLKMGFPKERIFAEIITNRTEDKIAVKERWANILNFSISQIRHVRYTPIATQEGARIQTWCAGLWRILHSADQEIREKLRNSPKETKIAYLRGIFAAEGSVRRMEIRILMKDQQEIAFIKEIFGDLGIHAGNIKFNKCNGAYNLSITGYKNIKKFKDMDGFKLHQKRKEKLESIFLNYDHKLPRYARLEQLKEIIKNDNFQSNHQLSKILNTGYCNTTIITKKLAERGILIVDKSEKELRYTLNKPSPIPK